MSSIVQNCVFCSKQCKASDSRPYSGSKSKERIHNRCQLKQNLANKQKKSLVITDAKSQVAIPEGASTSSNGRSDSTKTSLKESTVGLVEQMIEANQKIQRAAERDKMNRLISEIEAQKGKDRKSGSFFFDTKAGIAKPHEKRQYLHHRNICEIAPRYNDHGYQEEAIGRSYDHTGKDLDTLGDASDEDDADDTQAKFASSSSLRHKTLKRPISNDINDNNGRDIKRRLQATIKIDEKNPCWFCLTSPNVEKHLIIAIGEHCYLALAKGGLVDEHYLLIPIEHVQSVSSSLNSTELLYELENFKSSLIKYFGSQDKGVIFFERNFRSVHWQLQVVPVKLGDMCDLSTNIKSISRFHYTKSEYTDIPKNCTIHDIIPVGAPYLYWQIEPARHRFVCQIDVRDSFFPVQLPRMVLSDEKIMNCKDRVDWKRCLKSEDEYIQLVMSIKEKYERYDITHDFH